MEVWLHSFARPRRTAEAGRRAETLGYTGMLVADSQNLTAEVWVELAFAAAAGDPLLQAEAPEVPGVAMGPPPPDRRLPGGATGRKEGCGRGRRS